MAAPAKKTSFSCATCMRTQQATCDRCSVKECLYCHFLYCKMESVIIDGEELNCETMLCARCWKQLPYCSEHEPDDHKPEPPAGGGDTKKAASTYLIPDCTGEECKLKARCIRCRMCGNHCECQWCDVCGDYFENPDEDVDVCKACGEWQRQLERERDAAAQSLDD